MQRKNDVFNREEPSMSRYAVTTLFVSCLSIAFMHEVYSLRVTAAEDPPQYEQLVKELGSDDATTREAAADKLATAEAIPALVQATNGPDQNVARGAVEILTALLDSDKPEAASQANAAVTDLEKSMNAAVAALLKTALDSREFLLFEQLTKMGVRVSSRGERGMEISLGGRGITGIVRPGAPQENGGVNYATVLALLKRIRSPFNLRVSLGEEPLTLADLTALQGVHNMQSLSLSLLAKDDDLSQLAMLPSLKILSVKFTEGAKGNVLVHVGELSELEQLSLSDAPNLDEHLQHVVALPMLKSVSISYASSATNSGVIHLAKLQQLETLNLTNMPDLSENLPGLVALPTLKRLSLGGRSVTDGEMVSLANATGLEELSLRATSVTDDGLAHLTGLKQLRRLYMEEAMLTDDAIPHLIQLRGLTQLNIWASMMSSEGAAKLNRYFPSFHTNRRWCDPPLSAEDRQAVRKFIHLGGFVSIGSSGNSSHPQPPQEFAATLTDRWCGGIEGLQLLENLSPLTRIDVSTAMSTMEANELTKFSELRHIGLRNTGLTDEDLQFLTTFPNLKSVTLCGPFTDAAIPILAQTTVEGVDVRETLISDAGQRSLAQSLLPNRERGKRENEDAEVDRAIALAAAACVTLPPDPRMADEARRERNNARSQLGGFGVRAIPILYDMAQNTDRPIRIQAILVLHFFGNRSYAGGMSGVPDDQREAVFEKIQRAFQELKSWDEQNPGIDRSDDERGLIELGAFGGSLMRSPYDGRSYEVWIQYGWTGGDAGLSCLTKLKPLTNLRIASEGFTSAGLAVLHDLPDLQRLNIWLKHLDAAGLDNLPGLKQLKFLSIECPVSDEALKRLVGMESLTRLMLGAVSDEGLQYVGQLKQLTVLRFSGSAEFTGVGLRHLDGLSQLEELEISNAIAFTGQGLEHLAPLHGVRTLTFSGTNVLGESLAHLTGLRGLKELHIWDTPLNEVGVQRIGELKQLERLAIQHSNLLDEHLKYLTGLTQLKQLELRENGISDEGMVHLAKLPTLQQIDVSSTFVSDGSQAKLQTTMPETRRRAGVFNDMNFAREQKDERFTLTPEYLATAREIIRAGAGVWPEQSWSNVCLFCNWSGGDEKLELLGQLGKVRVVFIKAPLTDTAVPYLRKLTQVEVIRLDNARISDAGVEELKQALPNTRVLRPEDF